MTDKPKPTYRELVEATKAATGEPTEAELRSTYRRVEQSLAEGPGFSWLKWVAVGGALAVAASAVLVVRLHTPSAVPSQPMVAWVEMTSGSVDYLDADSKSRAAGPVLAHGASLRLGANGAARLEVDGVAEVAVAGPAELVVKTERLSLTFGRAAFAVKKRPAGTEFSVEAGDVRVVVHGTKFELAVSDGHLRGARVSEGIVELIADASKPGLQLTAGQSWGASFEALPAVEQPSGAPRGSTSVLQVQSEPPGASIDIDGVAAGVSPVVMRVTPGKHVARASLEGRIDVQKELVIEAAQGIDRSSDVHLVLTLEARPTDDDDDEPGTPGAKPNSVRSGSSKDPLQAARRALTAGKCNDVDRLVGPLARGSDEELRGRGTLLRAECQLHAGKKPAALALYQEVATLKGAGAEVAQFESAKLLSELNRKPEALPLFVAYLAQFPTGRFAAEADFRRCELLIDLQRRNEARLCLETFSSTRSDQARVAEAVFLLATLARVEKRWADGAQLYARYAESATSPRAEEALYQRVMCLERGALPGVSEAISAYLKRFPAGAHATALREIH